jgi:hypothetical protein
MMKKQYVLVTFYAKYDAIKKEERDDDGISRTGKSY